MNERMRMNKKKRVLSKEGGKREEGEDIQLVKIPVSEIEKKLEELMDAKTIVAVQWFLMNKIAFL